MYQFLVDNNECCIIDNIDMYLLYLLNNGITAFIVDDERDENQLNSKSYNSIPKFNPEIYRIYEVSEDGNKINIQNEDGLITKNYFDNLMKVVMDDFYVALNYYN